jgi:hypothetical protein
MVGWSKPPLKCSRSIYRPCGQMLGPNVCVNVYLFAATRFGCNIVACIRAVRPENLHTTCTKPCPLGTQLLFGRLGTLWFRPVSDAHSRINTYQQEAQSCLAKAHCTTDELMKSQYVQLAEAYLELVQLELRRIELRAQIQAHKP